MPRQYCSPPKRQVRQRKYSTISAPCAMDCQVHRRALAGSSAGAAIGEPLCMLEHPEAPAFLAERARSRVQECHRAGTAVPPELRMHRSSQSRLQILKARCPFRWEPQEVAPSAARPRGSRAGPGASLKPISLSFDGAQSQSAHDVPLHGKCENNNG